MLRSRVSIVMELSEWHRWYKSRGGRELRDLVMREWDPIGVSDIPEANTEYDGYLGRIAAQLRRGANTGEIAKFLDSVRTESMGLRPDPDVDLRVSRMIVSWYGESALGKTVQLPPVCPHCASEPKQVILELTDRADDGRRVCRQVIECPRGHGRFWRWQDRPTEPLLPVP